MSVYESGDKGVQKLKVEGGGEQEETIVNLNMHVHTCIRYHENDGLHNIMLCRIQRML